MAAVEFVEFSIAAWLLSSGAKPVLCAYRQQAATIKNTLDWLVSHPPFAGKPVAVLNPAYQSHHADEALKETLRIMSAELVEDACVRIPVIGSGVDPDAIAGSARFAGPVEEVLRAILRHLASRA